MSERIHISQKEIKELERRPRYVEQELHFKPHGFWYGVDGDWERWCESEMPHWIGGYRYSVDVSTANVLLLDTPRKIFKFHDEFVKERYPELAGKIMAGMYIDWLSVAQKYDGIEIAPYQWTLRMDTRIFWYYSWDCASGCIWNTDKITIRAVKTVEIQQGCDNIRP